MDYSLFISAISALIACGALWVAHRSHVATKEAQKNERHKAIRLRACELNSRVSTLLGKYALIESVLPAAQKDKPVMERYAGFLKITESMDAIINRTVAGTSDAELNDMEISLQQVIGAVQESEEKVDLMLSRI